MLRHLLPHTNRVLRHSTTTINCRQCQSPHRLRLLQLQLRLPSSSVGRWQTITTRVQSKTQPSIIQQQHRTTFSTSTATKVIHPNAKPNPSQSSVGRQKQQQQRGKWWYISNGMKLIRIPFVVFSVYKLGYHQGLMDFSRNPFKKKEEILTTIFSEFRAEVLSIGEGDSTIVVHTMPSDDNGNDDNDEYHNQIKRNNNNNGKTNAQLLKRVATVGSKIVHTARQLLRDEQEEYVTNRTDNTASYNYDNEQQIELDEMMDRIGIRHNDHRTENSTTKWTFYLIDTPIPNAFVSELMPHSIFVTTAMINQFIDTDDELALVLGHEISHLILGHSTTKNKIESALGVVEVLLISIDPTEGLLSVVVLSSLGYAKRALAAVHSRCNEREADTLGIQITAMACFDTKRAAHVFQKMADYDRGGGEGDDGSGVVPITHFTDTHPPSLERYLELMKMSEKENKEKYRDTHCALAKNRFMAALQFYSLGRG